MEHDDTISAQPATTNASSASMDDRPSLPLRPQRDRLASALDKAHIFANLFGDLYTDNATPIAIGRFTMLKHVGSGGMGDIYAAYDSKLDRKVAIKLVRSDLNADADTDNRLLREARTLARLSHPNVVHIYEAGTFGDRVFIAMEFIDGTTLREWLRAHARVGRRMRWRDVLRQFIAAGRGLEAAHKAGVVHRDFKPDNVLVCKENRPRVVDFGLARAIGGPLPAAHMGEALALRDHAEVLDDEHTGEPLPVDIGLRADIVLTRHGQIFGTPRYMSPEQIRGQPADQRSDQFSFCVALHEALYQRPPFPGRTIESLRQAMEAGQILDRIRDTDVPVSVHSALMRGLSADPDERFPSMASLLAQFEHSIDNQWQWPRRLAVLGLAIATSAALYAMVGDPVDACAELGHQLDDVWSPETIQRLERVFLDTDVPYARVTWNHVHERLDVYKNAWQRDVVATCKASRSPSSRISSISDTQPYQQRMLCLDQGRVQFVGLVDGLHHARSEHMTRAPSAVHALPDLAACQDLARLPSAMPLPAPAIAERVAAIRERLLEADNLYTLHGKPVQATKLARQQVDVANAIEYGPIQAETMLAAGQMLIRHGKTLSETREGERLLERAESLAEGVHHDEVVARARLALVLSAKRNHPDTRTGQAWSRRAFASVQRIGKPTRHHASALRLAGQLAFKDNQFAQAVSLHRQALSAVDGDPAYPPLQRAHHLQVLATALAYDGHKDEARRTYEQARDVITSELGALHPDVADVQFDIAMLFIRNGELDNARDLLLSLLSVQTDAFGADHPIVGRTHLELADVYRQQGAFEMAMRHLENGFRSYRPAYSDSHPKLANRHQRFGAIAYRRGQFRVALDAYQRALAILQRHKDPLDFDLGYAYANIAEAQLALEQYQPALDALDRAAPIFEPHMSKNPKLSAFLDSVRGRVLLGLGDRMAEAVQVLKASNTAFATVNGMDVERADTQWALARALTAHEQIKSERARQLARDALTVYRAQTDQSQLPIQQIDTWLAPQPVP